MIFNIKKEKIIVLDCDGVLLDYNEAFGRVWQEYYNKELPVFDGSLYHAENYYNLKWSHIDERKKFFNHFNTCGWSIMKDFPQSIEATHLLREAGYKILVVTSMSLSGQAMRHENLTRLGFAIDATIATGSKINNTNPKKTYIENLNPDFFVDDLLSNFEEINNQTNFVLIDNRASDSPNLITDRSSILLHSTHSNLWNFVHDHI